MKPHYLKTKLPFFILSLTMITTLVSCGTAQTVTSNDDGIYSNETEQPQRRVVEVDSREYKKYNENYFTKEVQRLDEINGTDIITDIEDYNSYTDEDIEEVIIEEEAPRTRITLNEPWGYGSDADVVINVNTFPRRWGGFYGNYYDPWDPFWNRRYAFGLSWNRWNRWGWNNPFWHPYHINSGFFVGAGVRWGNPFYCPPGFVNSYRYGPYRSTYRGANPYRGRYVAANNRRANTTNRRSTTTSRRNLTLRNERNPRSTTRRGNTTRPSTRTIRDYDRNGRVRSTRSTRSIRNSRSTSPTRRSRSVRSSRSYSPNRNTRTARSNRSTRTRRSYNSSRSSRSFPSRSTSPSRSFSSNRSSSRGSSSRGSSSRGVSRGGRR